MTSRHTVGLLWCGRYRSPSPWALLDIRVIVRRIVTVIPRGLWRRGDRELSGWRDDNGRVSIRVGIGVGVRPPVGSPEWPDPDPDGEPWAAKPMEASAKPSMEASEPPSSPRSTRTGAGHEQHHQHHKDSHPRQPLAC